MVGPSLLLLLFLILEGPDGVAMDRALQRTYCSLNCGMYKNSVCQNKCVAKKCSLFKPDLQWRTRMMHVHNQKRQIIAQGQDTRGGNKKARNMMTLNYDMGLEFTAACWVMSAARLRKGNVTDPVLEKDNCPRTKKWIHVYQNVWTKTDWRVTQDTAPREAVDEWYEQINNVTYDQILSYNNSEPDVSAFTQLVWATTTHVGCGGCRIKDAVFVACNYAVGGNVLHGRVYVAGEPGTYCPGNETNEVVDGLCGKLVYQDWLTHEGLGSLPKVTPNVSGVLVGIIVALSVI